MQAQLSQIVIFGKTFSKSKLLFQILPLNRELLQGYSFRRTHQATLSTCKNSSDDSQYLPDFSQYSQCSLFHLQYLFFHSKYSFFPLIVLVFPLVVLVCPLVVLLVLSVGLFITDLFAGSTKCKRIGFMKKSCCTFFKVHGINLVEKVKRITEFTNIPVKDTPVLNDHTDPFTNDHAFTRQLFELAPAFD